MRVMGYVDEYIFNDNDIIQVWHCKEFPKHGYFLFKLSCN